MNEKGREKISCPVCGSSQGPILYHAFDKLAPRRQDTFPLMRCGNCGLAYLNPRPATENKASLYNQDYLFNPERRPLPLKHYTPVIERVCARKPGRILDVGTGNSPFLPAMRERGWEVYGTEVNDSLVDWFEKEQGIALFRGELEQVGFESGFFDAVTIMGVLEHTSQPVRLLKEVSRILKDDGILCLWCFNRSVEAALLGKYWMGFDAPRHLFSFSSKTLEKVLNEAGFRLVETKFSRAGSLGHSAAWALAMVGNRLRGVKTRHDYLLKIPAPIKMINKPLGLILSRLGMSATMYVFAVKAARF